MEKEHYTLTAISRWEKKRLTELKNKKIDDGNVLGYLLQRELAAKRLEEDKSLEVENLKQYESKISESAANSAGAFKSPNDYLGLSAAVDSLTRALIHASNENQRLLAIKVANASEYDEKIEQQRHTLDNLQNKQAALEKSLDIKCAEIRSLEGQYEESQKNIEEAEAEIQELQSKCFQLEKKLEIANNEVEKKNLILNSFISNSRAQQKSMDLSSSDTRSDFSLEKSSH